MCDPLEPKVMLTVWVPAELSHTGEGREEQKPIDPCIAPIVKALNEGGVITVSSCCGHGVEDGTIALLDGRELIVRGSGTISPYKGVDP